MITNTITPEMFREAVHTAALADYLFISEQTNVGNECETIASEPVARALLELFEALDIGSDGYMDDDNPMFIQLVFHSASEKERADDYFMSFNFGLRRQCEIDMPDIYEDNSEPVTRVWQQYQTTIHHFFLPNSGRPLRIPIGKDPARIADKARRIFGTFHGIDEGGRAGRTLHAEYTEAGLKGFMYYSNW